MTPEEIKQLMDGITGRLDSIETMSKETQNKLLQMVKDAQPVSKLGISEEACGNFLKMTRGLLAGDIAEVKAVSGAADATGGYLIPTEVAATILQIAPTYGVVSRYATVWPMKSKSMNVPKSILDLYDYVIDEAAAMTAASGNLFGVVALAAKKHGTIVPITDEMIENASVNVVDFLVQAMAWALSGGRDSIGFLGKTLAGTTVSSMPGILANADVTAVTTSGTTFGTLTTGNMDDCISAVSSRVLNGARFYMNSKVLFGVVAKLKENVGDSARAVYTPASGTNPAMWRGFPIEMVEVLPGTTAVNTKFICFGNLKYLLLGQREGVSMDTAREATIVEGATTFNLWQQGMKALKVEEQMDLKVAFGSGFSYVKTTAS